MNVLNFTTYFEMKARAGTVGKNGVGPLIDHACAQRRSHPSHRPQLRRAGGRGRRGRVDDRQDPEHEAAADGVLAQRLLEADERLLPQRRGKQPGARADPGDAYTRTTRRSASPIRWRRGSAAIRPPRLATRTTSSAASAATARRRWRPAKPSTASCWILTAATRSRQGGSSTSRRRSSSLGTATCEDGKWLTRFGVRCANGASQSPPSDRFGRVAHDHVVATCVQWPVADIVQCGADDAKH